MRWMSGRARLATVALAVIAAVVAGGCGGGGAGGDKAGGAGEPVVLRMANAYGDLDVSLPIQDFVSQVEERSGGNLRIEVVNAGATTPTTPSSRSCGPSPPARSTWAGRERGCSTRWASPASRRCRRRC